MQPGISIGQWVGNHQEGGVGSELLLWPLPQSQGPACFLPRRPSVWSRYSSGRLQEACRMLERAVTDTITVPSKLAVTREPLRVIMTPVVLKISWSRMLGDR